MSDKFVDLTEIKDYCKVDYSEDKYDNFFNMLNEHITAAIQNWLGRNIVQKDYVEFFDIEDRQNTLFTHQYPIISVAGLTNNGKTLYENEDYYIYKD